MDKYLLINEIYDMNSNMFTYEYITNVLKLNDYLIELRNNDSHNFVPVIHYIDAIIDEMKLYMESLNEMDYDEWKRLDLILYNLEITKTKINQTLYNATDLSMIFKKLNVNSYMDMDMDNICDDICDIDSMNTDMDNICDTMNINYEADTEDDIEDDMDLDI